MTEYYLEPKYDTAKSFYKKAVVDNAFDEGRVKTLYSYGIRVCAIKNGAPEVYGTYSVTTLRHIKEFLKQHGFVAESKKQILAAYYTKKTGGIFI